MKRKLTNELTTEEKEALTERIDNDKNEILSKIDDQTTDEACRAS